MAPAILARTNLVATLAERVANEFASLQDLKILPCPLPIDGFSVFMRSHQSNHNDMAHCWLRNLMLEITKIV